MFMRRQLAHEAPPLYRSFTTTTTTARPRTPQPPLQICRACRRPAPKSPPADDEAEPPPKASPIPKTHYDFFPLTLPSGPPPAGPFKIDARALRREFLQLQSVAHPDRHPQELKSRAEATSARINEAYRTLLNPLLRAQYLLGLRGIGVVDDERAKVEDTGLLIEVLEARETIEEADGEEDLLELREANEGRIEESERVLDGAFREDDMQLAKAEAVKLRYWVNIKESLDGWEKEKPVVIVH
ncbi:Fe-S protein assembly co-chaperone HscB [Drepanopeziza brunnea f. sp. 'multigermtubi' MB_m1]|uniref:Fe-S protein assembly co-chaperone HscB n=1 Tax=Marssonina brunnea f. sp. multigermtubi (strain MB_m1) TaxID=1072389 RepID=K1XUC3_MARBU|nr:Fe-S protein assembly co-chaperone HscB [Drepanopeziza brunnea f. sp. 'multigermtubi' MB_m1]EKD16264.1 Fe-S protein assembly co-chaperone HscB [Drepanopeziza brunnea f. sp. 'multigermtubi' MB_m1]